MAADLAPRIDFSKLKCFPELDGEKNKIVTKAFLESAQNVIDSIGMSQEIVQFRASLQKLNI